MQKIADLIQFFMPVCRQNTIDHFSVTFGGGFEMGAARFRQFHHDHTPILGHWNPRNKAILFQPVHDGGGIAIGHQQHLAQLTHLQGSVVAVQGGHDVKPGQGAVVRDAHVFAQLVFRMPCQTQKAYPGAQAATWQWVGCSHGGAFRAGVVARTITPFHPQGEVRDAASRCQSRRVCAVL